MSEEEGRSAVQTALDEGIDFLDTADVCGDGRSERLIGDVLEDRSEYITVATKEGHSQDTGTPSIKRTLYS